MADNCVMDATLSPRSVCTASDDVQKTVLGSLEQLSDLYDYNHAAYARIRPYLKGSVCEVGCGIGNVIQFLLNHPRVVGVEPFSESIARVRSRFSDHANVSFVQNWLHECPNEDLAAESFDSVICLRVMEYIEDDQDALVRLGRLCKPGGSVVVIVSAHPSAFGPLDEALGHRRRYRKRELARMFQRAEMDVVAAFHSNIIGYFGWLWHSRICKRRSIPSGGADLSNQLAPFLYAFERVLPMPVGQSLIMVGSPNRSPEVC